MLYLVQPHRLQWSDLPHTLVKFAREHEGIDFEKVPWQPAERRLNGTLVRLALRHGYPTPRGIVVPGTAFVHEGRAEDIERLHREANAAHAKLADSDELMETLIPGWKKHGEELSARVDEAVAGSVREARQDLAADLEAPVDASLVALWERLGGYLPEPL